MSQGGYFLSGDRCDNLLLPEAESDADKQCIRVVVLETTSAMDCDHFNGNSA